MSDRGMKKWNPFKALQGQFELIDQIQKEKGKEEKPILSLDKLNELNETISQADVGDVYLITYYENGFILKEQMVLVKVDLISKLIIFEDKKLYIKDILDIERG